MSTRAQRLNQYLADQRTRRFRPGVHDCGSFTLGWVSRETGADHFERWRGRYRSMEQLDAIMTEAGFPDHLEYVASVLKEIPPAFARVGDVAAVQDKCLGLVSDEHVFILRPDGLGRVSRIAARRAFRV